MCRILIPITGKGPGVQRMLRRHVEETSEGWSLLKASLSETWNSGMSFSEISASSRYIWPVLDMALLQALALSVP